VDKVRKKAGGFYVVVMNKREEAFKEENIRLFLEATWEIEKNKSTFLLQQKRLYYAQLKKTQEVLEEVTKQFRQFADNVRVLYY
jgi:hypothetical protein